MYIQEGFLKWGQTFVGTYYLEDINKKLKKLRSKFKTVHCEINFRSGI